VLDQMRDDFRIGLAREFEAEPLEFRAQLFVILDDAVVHDRDRAARRDRVRIDRARRTMRRPAGVRDAGETHDRLRSMQRFEFTHLALRTHAFEAVIGQQRDARGIVAAVLERLQPVDQRSNHIAPRGGADYSAHDFRTLNPTAYFSRFAP